MSIHNTYLYLIITDMKKFYSGKLFFIYKNYAERGQSSRLLHKAVERLCGEGKIASFSREIPFASKETTSCAREIASPGEEIESSCKEIASFTRKSCLIKQVHPPVNKRFSNLPDEL